jgi:hypothetical protein
MTDLQGRISVGLDESPWLLAVVDRTGYAVARAQDKATLKLAPFESLEGIVVDQAGVPIPGATITKAGSSSASSSRDDGKVMALNAIANWVASNLSHQTTDEEGRFSVPLLSRPRSNWTLTVSAADHADVKIPLTASDEPITVTLPPKNESER